MSTDTGVDGSDEAPLTVDFDDRRELRREMERKIDEAKREAVDEAVREVERGLSGTR